MMVEESGRTMRKKNLKSLQPSIFAASSSSFGMPVSKKERHTIRLYAETATGSTMAQMVSYIWSWRTTRYSGIMPPLKNIVKVNRNISTRRPGRSILERA